MTLAHNLYIKFLSDESSLQWLKVGLFARIFPIVCDFSKTCTDIPVGLVYVVVTDLWQII